MTASNPHDLKIGDTRFIPPMGRGGGRTVIIDKIGAKHAHVTYGRAGVGDCIATLAPQEAEKAT